MRSKATKSKEASEASVNMILLLIVFRKYTLFPIDVVIRILVFIEVLYYFFKRLADLLCYSHILCKLVRYAK